MPGGPARGADDGRVVAADRPLTQGQAEAVIYAAGLLLGVAARREAAGDPEDAEGVRGAARWLAREFPSLGLEIPPEPG